MKTYNIGVIAGDGIGPEVVAEGLKVLRAVTAGEDFDCNLVEYPYSGDYYLKTKELVPERVIEEWRTLDAVFLGAIGHPDVEPGLVERSVILGLRFGLDLYINLRPIKLYAAHLCPLKDKGPQDIDFVVVRENTEGLYAQIGGFLKKGTPDEVATVTGVYTRKGVERAVRYAFDLAQQRAAGRDNGRPSRLTLVDKSNAIRPQDIWRRTYDEVAEEYPEVEKDYAYVDACTMWMVKKPEWFDTIVTTNLFGDIITDLGAMLQGGMGIAASGNLHPGKTSMFEPIHGSAPDIAGRGIANPIAAIWAGAMMLDHLGERAAHDNILRAVERVIGDERVKTPDLGGRATTAEMTKAVTAALAAQPA